MADDAQEVPVEVNVALDDTIEDAPLLEALDGKTSDTADNGKDNAADTEDAEKTDEQPTEGEQEPINPEQTAEATRQHNAEMARQRVQDRQRTQQQIAEQLKQEYAPKSEEDLIEEGHSREDARYQALREEMAFKERVTEIAQMNAGMQSDAVNALNDFSVYNPQSKDYDEEFTSMVQQQYQIAARLQADEQGRVVNAEVPLYDFYKSMNDLYNRGASRGNTQGQQAAMATLANVENPGGSSASGSGNDLDDLEERLGNVVIT